MTDYRNRGDEPFYRPPGEMPLILCGPMLREVTCTSVSVFLALKEPCKVKLRVYTAPSGVDLVDEGQLQSTLPIGRRLHLIVVTLDLKTSKLSPGVIYGYDLVFEREGLAGGQLALSQDAVTLLDASGYSGGKGAITYGDDKLPSFVLPAKEAVALRLVHGSCRKPHGQGRDMLAMLDDLLRMRHAQPDERPQLLMLTGDQIYADDVSPILLRCINDSLPMVLGWRETIPSPHLLLPPGIPPPGLPLPPLPPWLSDDVLTSDGTWIPYGWDETAWLEPTRASRIAPPQRGKEVRLNARLSSDCADAHLIFLGEFLLMYLFCWSDTLWPRDPSGDFRLPQHNEAVPAYSLFGAYSHAALEEQQRTIRAFAQGLKKVRRALANIPTWMIFDDHEVTDDWNLNRDWVKRVNTSSMGSRILRNALVAYALCQDWGSRPKEYRIDKPSGGSRPEEDRTDKPGVAILEAMRCKGLDTPEESWEKKKNPPEPHAELGPSLIRSTPEELDEFLAIGPTHSDKTPKITWHYTIEPHGGDADYRLLVLDTRTCRGFPKQTDVDRATSRLKTLLGDSQPAAGLVMNASLLSPAAFKEQLEKRLDGGKLVNIIVSPAPMFGVTLVEDVMQRFEIVRTNPEYADNEAWSGDHEAMPRLVELLRERSTAVVILSGDVHYSFTHRIRLKDDAKYMAMQLCSSAVMNESGGTRFLGTTPQTTPAKDEDVLTFWNHRFREIDEKLKAMVDEYVTHGGPLDDLQYFTSWFNETPAFYDPPQLLLKLRDLNPLALPDKFLLPMRLVSLGGVVLGIYGWLKQDIAHANPLYSVQPLRDDRKAYERDSPVVPPGGWPPIPPDAARAYSGEEARQIVGYNNIAEIRFSAGNGGGVTVEHLIHWPVHDSAQQSHDTFMTTSHSGKLRAT